MGYPWVPNPHPATAYQPPLNTQPKQPPQLPQAATQPGMVRFAAPTESATAEITCHE